MPPWSQSPGCLGEAAGHLQRPTELPEVVVHIATNYMATKRDVVLQGEYRELGQRLKCKTSGVVISRLFLMPHANEGKNRKTGQVDEWLKS